MRNNRRFRLLALVALCAAATAGCLGARGPAGPEPSPAELYARAFGANPGLSSLRSVVEARLSYAGRRVSLPGVLLLDTLGGFRLDLLDPLDKPVAVFYSDGGRIVQYRPGTGIAASLGVLPSGCKGVPPEDWVAAVLASSPGPPAAEQLSVRTLFRGDRVLERRRHDVLYQSTRLHEEAGQTLPRLFAWHCGEDVALQVKVTRWVQGGERRLPAILEIEYPLAALNVALELREIETNPSLAGSPVRLRLADSTRWTSWRLP